MLSGHKDHYGYFSSYVCVCMYVHRGSAHRQLYQDIVTVCLSESKEAINMLEADKC